MLSGATSCFPHSPQSYQVYEGMEEMVSSAAGAASGVNSHSQTLLYNLSVLREKVQQVQSLVSIVVYPDQIQHESAAAAVANAGTIIQEIIVAASSMMYAFQRVATGSVAPSSGNELPHDNMKPSYEGSPHPSNEGIDQVLHNLGNTNRSIFDTESHYNNSNSIGPIISTTNGDSQKKLESPYDVEKSKEFQDFSSVCDIIELDAADLLAKYTHYCQVCGKGFKRDANLRMHMRAHGDEYKTSAALSNPMKSGDTALGQKEYSMMGAPRKYSCPHEGCRWNRKHAKFQPLKSMICVKNHYKRSHCPKMYVCNRCSRKQFSVLSDLRTHEKHCGDLKWQCSCGTTFSRKDKLMGHVALFVGHSPVVNCFSQQGSQDYRGMQNGIDGR